jgi:3'-5' exoribonuclease
MEIVGYAEILLKADYTWIKHIIASHHGNREWGAIQEPSTREAMIVHFADLFSSRIDMFDGLKGTDGKVWQKYLNRWIFEGK